ncbi:hypothetical protein AGDE_04367 [Angomonas deanei]|nr:hypothetical protein AGDE_10644 [Angomonas deanei]EPY39561.1 hypothetical protein AGDE_04367 [Angomonas deanei]|eukprot:EPY27682.1 hypothetical protein AGDE_10644 [Angomonas deanei]
MLKIMQTVAQKHPDVKFVSIVSTEAIPNFPDKHVPCVLLYHKRELVRQMTTLDPWKHGRNFDVGSVESVLASNGVIQGESDED